MTRYYTFLCLFVFLFGRTLAAETFDIVIYGGTCAAVTSAIQAKNMGKSVIVVSPDKHLGGLTSGGLGMTDSGKTASVGGLSRQFYERVYTEYQKDETWRWEKQSEYTNNGQGTKAMLHDERTMWVFEPHVAEAVFEKWVADNQITIVRNAWLDREKGVKKNGKRIISITTLDGKTYEGKMFIDATYEGDLMAAAGVQYTIGREANSEYSETYNGNQFDKIKHHHFTKPVDPYIVPGDPASGLLKYIDNSKEGVSGEADKRVQAYCYRLCMTDHEPNRVPFPKPVGYNPTDYELLLRVLQSQEPKEYDWVFRKFDRIPNHKTDTNNHGAFSMDFIGMNYDYPDASYEKRKEIETAHRNYQLGWCYFLANDERVPTELRQRVNEWGLAKDEFLDNKHFSHQLYVREARRMVGEYMMTQHNCQNTVVCPKPVGMGSYGLDSHNVRRYVTDKGTVQNEGDIQIGLKAPYSIDYGALVPKRDECTNLLVPVCVSCTHIAFGSIRMEPVFMILGQSAATAAALSIDEGIDVQQLDYEKLKERLLQDGQRLMIK
ncbi:hypothetical protein FACS1894189_2920 [Planctomycetales bacterium]|nr:hypothetical protein FACS1894189_2920 [Planctomycetales bacterium]